MCRRPARPSRLPHLNTAAPSESESGAGRRRAARAPGAEGGCRAGLAPTRAPKEPIPVRPSQGCCGPGPTLRDPDWERTLRGWWASPSREAHRSVVFFVCLTGCLRTSLTEETLERAKLVLSWDIQTGFARLLHWVEKMFTTSSLLETEALPQPPPSPKKKTLTA